MQYIHKCTHTHTYEFIYNICYSSVFQIYLVKQLEHLWKELCLLSVYIKIQEYCNKVRINLSNIAGQRYNFLTKWSFLCADVSYSFVNNHGSLGPFHRECPIDLEEPVASLCFVASCCADLPELQELREIFASKYGANFVTFAQELKDTSHVNRSVSHQNHFSIFYACLCPKP